MDKEKVLIVEDEVITLKLLNHTLMNHGFQTLKAEDGKTAIEHLDAHKICAAILDLNLPDYNGMDILREIRRHPTHQSIPIIILTNNTDKIEAIVALEMGADDYITKPFHQRELIARLNVGLRRAKSFNEKLEVIKEIQFGDVVLNLENRQVLKGGLSVSLTFKEFEVLALLVRNPGKVFSRDKLLTDLWGEQYIAETRTIDMHISSIRNKLGDNNKDYHYIETIRGVGYRFRK
jgi:two-component system alkaline phosphatase synthesis response regulator PhoP